VADDFVMPAAGEEVTGSAVRDAGVGRGVGVITRGSTERDRRIRRRGWREWRGGRSAPSDISDSVEPGRGGREGWLVPVLAIVAAIGLVGTVGFGVAWAGLHGQQRTRTEVEALSRKFLLALTNFQASTIDADFNRIQSYATGDFAKQAQSFFGSDIRQAMQQVAASSRGQIRYLFTEDLHGSTASVYAVVDQTIINNKFKTPEPDELRLDLTLQHTDAVWRVSEVTVLQGPPVANSPLTGQATQ
jgi:hypothetical protein